MIPVELKIKTLILVLTFYLLNEELNAQSRNASFSPDGAKIVYVSKVDGINQIFTMDKDGTNKNKITNTSNSNYYPFLSPNGKKIVFMSLVDNKTIICTINLDGTEYKCLTNIGDETADPNWSPDGKHIVFSSAKEGNNEIYIMDDEGRNWTRLTNHTASDQTPSISPDGKHIVFVSNRHGNNELYIMNSNGVNSRRLTFDPRSDRVPRWSTDSKKIIWYSREPVNVAGSGKKSWDGAEVYEIEINGSNRKQLTHNHFRDQSANFSPDGKHIVFTSKRTGEYEVFIMNMDDKSIKQLTGVK